MDYSTDLHTDGQSFPSWIIYSFTLPGSTCLKPKWALDCFMAIATIEWCEPEVRALSDCTFRQTTRQSWHKNGILSSGELKMCKEVSDTVYCFHLNTKHRIVITAWEGSMGNEFRSVGSIEESSNIYAIFLRSYVRQIKCSDLKKLGGT